MADVGSDCRLSTVDHSDSLVILPAMIARLEGLLAYKGTDQIVIDVQGVGYAVHTPLTTYYELGDVGTAVRLHIYTHVSDVALALYGFHTLDEKRFFTALIQISGIGPRLAVTILSGLPVEELIDAVGREDLARLSSIPGVGKKTAERMTLELKDRIADLLADTETEASSSAGGLQRDLVSALVNLGYPKAKSEKAVSEAMRESDSEEFDALLKQALKEIA